MDLSNYDISFILPLLYQKSHKNKPIEYRMNKSSGDGKSLPF